MATLLAPPRCQVAAGSRPDTGLPSALRRPLSPRAPVEPSGAVQQYLARNPGLSGPGGIASTLSCRSPLLLDVLLDERRGGAAGGCGEVGRGPEMLTPQVSADVPGELLSQPPGGDALKGADQAGQGNPGRVVHEQVDVVGLAVELAQFGAEVRAHVPHDFLTAAQDLASERVAPVLRREDQVSMKAVDNGPAPAYVGVSFPAW